MTREEFKYLSAAADNLTRRTPWGIIFSILLAAVPSIIYLVIFLLWSGINPDRPTIFGLLGLLVILCIGSIAFYYVRANKIRKLAPKCPACHRFLSLDEGQVEIAIRTGKCSYCDARLFED